MKLKFGDLNHKRVMALIAENKKLQDKIDKNNETIEWLRNKEDDKKQGTMFDSISPSTRVD